MIFLNDDKLNDYICTMNAIAEMYIPFSWKCKISETEFITGFPTKYGNIGLTYTMDKWDMFKVPILPETPYFTNVDSLEVLNILETTVKESGSSYMSDETYRIILDIVRKDIIPLFNEDKLKEATFISFFNK